MCDIMFLPFFLRFDLLSEYCNFEVSKEKYPNIMKVYENNIKSNYFLESQHITDYKTLKDLYEPYLTQKKKWIFHN
jgi:hypothetical protein